MPYEPSLPVRTAWDLGIGDSTAIWFYQTYLTEIRIIRYSEYEGKGLPDIAKEVKSYGYVFEEHLLPHDAAARELGTGVTRQKTFEDLFGKGMSRIIPRQSIDDGIHAVRMLLPRCVFDKEFTERGVECLINYERQFDSKAKAFKTTPSHNWASHGADGFRTLAMGYKDPTKKQMRRDLPRQAESEYSVYG